MRLHLFADHKQCARQAWAVSAENIRLGAELAEQAAQLAEQRQQIADAHEVNRSALELVGQLTEERDYCYDRWIEVGERDISSGTVAAHALAMVAVLQQQVADLEQIAGPHVDAASEPTPIHSAVTQDIPLPARFDSEQTAELTRVRPFADALGGAA